MNDNRPDNLTPLRIVLQPLPHTVPASCRLRQFLKRALRDWGLRCLSIEPLPPSEPPCEPPSSSASS